MPGNFDGLQRQNSRDRFLGEADDFLRNASHGFRGQGSFSADPSSLARTADQISEHFENIYAERIWLGKGSNKSNWTGIILGYPAITSGSEDWNLLGLNAGALQVGIRASDGKLLAGAGNVTLDAAGITLTAGSGSTNQVKWSHVTLGDLGIIYTYNPSGTISQMDLQAGFYAGDADNIQGDVNIFAASADSGAGVDAQRAALVLSSKDAANHQIVKFVNIDGATTWTLFRIERDPYQVAINAGVQDVDFYVYGDTAAIIQTDAAIDGLGFFGATPVAPRNWTVAGVTPDRTFNPTNTSAAEIAQVLGTVITDLIELGLFS